LSALNIAASYTLPSSLDDEAASGHLMMIALTHDQLTTTRVPIPTNPIAAAAAAAAAATATKHTRGRRRKGKSEFADAPDVWREPNVTEVGKLEGPLCALMERVRSILALYPQHPILLLIVRIAHRIAGLSSNSPVMKMLTGVELLLKKSEG
jgi:hypothetical protein